jgi:hypothetical protein
MLRFGGDDKTIFNGVTVQGNVGLRYVQTKTTSSGGVAFPTNTWYTTGRNATPCGGAAGPNGDQHLVLAEAQLLAFSNGGGSPTTSAASRTTTGCPASTSASA